MEMDLVPQAIAASCLLLLVAWAWRVLNWAWFTPKRIEKRLRQQGFKGSPYKFLVGDAKESAKMLQEVMSKPMEYNHDIFPRLMPHIDKAIKTYGENTFTWDGAIPRVHILKPELIKEILTHSRKFQKHFAVQNPLIKLLLTGVGAYEGDKWATHRRILSPALTLEKLKDMLPAFVVCYGGLLSKWEEIASKEGSVEVDLFPTFDVTTSDVISKVAFDSTYQEGRKIFLLLKEQMDLTTAALRDFYIPGWRFLPTKRNNRMKSIDRELRNMITNMINKRVKAMKSGEPLADDILGVLLESNSKEIQNQRNKKNIAMTIDDVIDECILFYFAGQETTGILLTWTIILLSKHPEWQERAREEVLQAFGKNKPEFDKLNHLKYVNMILHEVLRLYPPVFDLNKVVYEDTKLGPYTIPAGCQLELVTPMLHRDKTIWGEDAMEFNPMRFADGVATATKNQVAFIPFSWGPRVCLGQNFALLQAKMGLTMILQRFSFDVSPSYVHAPFTILTLQPQFGSHAIFKKLE